MNKKGKRRATEDDEEEEEEEEEPSCKRTLTQFIWSHNRTIMQYLIKIHYMSVCVCVCV